MLSWCQPLAAATTYYWVRNTANLAQLAATYANALAGVVIDLTTAGTGIHTVTQIDQSRYTCHGTVDTVRRPLDILKDLMTGGAGAITYTAGQFRVFAGAYASPSVTLTEEDLRGPIVLNARVPRKDLFNAVRGTYTAPLNEWQPSDFPPIANTTYAAQDGGEVIYRDIQLPYCTDPIRAQRIAKIHLEKSRQGLTVKMPCKMTAFRHGIWDTVLVNNTRFGWSGKIFRITEWSLAGDGMGVDLTLREESAASYDWALGDQSTVDTAPDTNLPSAFTVATPGTPVVTEVLYETSGSAGAKSKAVATWTASTGPFIAGYEAQYKAHADATWLGTAGAITATTIEVLDLAPGLYDLRVRAITTLGVRSAWTPTVTREILGLTAPPADVTSFTVTKSTGFALAAWDLHADLDVRIGGGIVVRYSSLTTGATWSDSVVFDTFPGGSVQGLVALKTGTYMAKAVDSTGNYSANAVTFNVTEGMITGFTTVATVTEHAAFTGTKTNILLTGGGIQLDSSLLWDSVAGNIDSWTDIDGQGVLASTGTYLFASRMDCVTVATRRVEFSITASAFDLASLMDARTDLIDDWDSVETAIINDCDIQTWARFTDADPAGSPTWSSWKPFYVADETFRGAEFKATFASGDVNHNIKCTALSVASKIP